MDVSGDGRPSIPRTCGILQVLDKHRIQNHSFVLSAGEEWGTFHVLLEIDPEKVSHVRAVLLRLESVYGVECLAAFDGLCRTVALFEANCVTITQLPALHLTIISVDGNTVVVEVVETFQEMAGIERALSQLGALTTIAKATLGIAPSESLRAPRKRTAVAAVDGRETSRR
jgi:hypothetical protein